MTIYGQVVMNVIHFRNVSDFYTPLEIKNEFVDNWIMHVRGFQNPGLHYFNLAVKNMDDETGITTDFPLDIFGGGFFGSQTWPTTAVLVQIRTAFGGRKGRGRVFVAGLHTGAFENGLFNAATTTSLNTFMDAIKAAFLPGGTSQLTIGVCDRGFNPDFHPAVDLVVGSRPGIQRRRNIGVGI
jgi:hypothetical protein